MTTVLDDIAAERARQLSMGWTPEHDEHHDRGELAMAASAYAFRYGQLRAPLDHPSSEAAFSAPPPSWWPWRADAWRATSYRRMLVKAAALLVAEIELLDRTIGDRR
jgi:hypothetical protein